MAIQKNDDGAIHGQESIIVGECAEPEPESKDSNALKSSSSESRRLER